MTPANFVVYFIGGDAGGDAGADFLSGLSVINILNNSPLDF